MQACVQETAFTFAIVLAGVRCSRRHHGPAVTGGPPARAANRILLVVLSHLVYQVLHDVRHQLMQQSVAIHHPSGSIYPASSTQQHVSACSHSTSLHVLFEEKAMHHSGTHICRTTSLHVSICITQLLKPFTSATGRIAHHLCLLRTS